MSSDCVPPTHPGQCDLAFAKVALMLRRATIAAVAGLSAGRYPPHSQPRALRHTSLSVMRHKKSHKVRLSRRLNASTSLGAHHPCTPPTTSGSSGRARPVTIASQVGLSCAVGRWLGLGLASPKRKGTR